MKRYKIIDAIFMKPYPEQWDMEEIMIEDDTGEWVKYEDHKAEMQLAEHVSRTLSDKNREQRNEIWLLKAELSREAEPLPQIDEDNILKVRDVTDCNCKKMALSRIFDEYWICPAHGYKKR